MTKIIAVAAHPGDSLFTMGAIVGQCIADGGSGIIVNLTLGEKGHPRISPPEYGEMQREATRKAAQILGAATAFLPYRDAEIPAGDEPALAVCDLIREHQPSVVITHWNGSWHKDHTNTYRIVRDAVFYAALHALPRAHPAHAVRKLYFAENWEDAANFQPDTYADISPVYEKWIRACAMFPMWRGETGLIRYNDYYQSLAVMRGCLAQCEYAIALMSDPEQRSKRVTCNDL